MAGVKIVTRKLVPWHNRQEEFSNVYFFGDGGVGLSPSAEVAEDIVEAVITAEKLVCANVVRFLGGAAYHIGVSDTPGDTDAIATVELAATGNNGSMNTDVSNPLCDPEYAVDLKFLLGGRRYLRTMIHTGCTHGYNVLQAGSGTASTSLSSAIRAFATKMLNGPWVGDYQRIAPNGDRPTAIQYNPFLEHRQFHRYRVRNAGLLG